MKSSPVRLPECGLTGEERALVALGCELRGRGYRFTTVTPSTHRRILGRTAPGTSSLEDVFGWSRPFRAGDLPTTIVDHLADSGALRSSASVLQSAVRFSTLGEQLFVHSAFPTEETDAVFFGPDTYRFARAIRGCLATLQDRSCLRIIDVGAGSGAGGLHAAALLAETTPEILLTDVNLRALRYCRINAAMNGISLVQTVQSDLFENVHGKFDLIISNPPYLVDPLTRLYRHGGGEFGSALSLMIVEQGIERLAPGGRLLLYTGSAIVDGSDPFYEALRSRLTGRGIRFQYEEIDPDVFSEELEHPPYDRADRIAVVGVTIEIEGGNV
jgi:methylase of polypeptide subunit release factors